MIGVALLPRPTSHMKALAQVDEMSGRVIKFQWLYLYACVQHVMYGAMEHHVMKLNDCYLWGVGLYL